MATATTARLLQAIEGFAGENAGKKEHESNVELLNRVKGELERGHKSPESIGAREAKQASQRGMPAEQAHSSGDGQHRSNEPGSFSGHEQPPDLHEGSSEEEKLKSAGPVPSHGGVIANSRQAAAPSGVVEIRRMAAMKELEAGRSSGGNAKANTPGPPPEKESRIGDVAAPAKAPADKNRTGDQWEGNPAGALAGAEQLRGDGWTRAREKAKKIAPAAR